MKQFSKGSQVQWNWGNGTGIGVIQESFTEHVTKTIKGTEVTRDAEPNDPAYLIKQEDGDKVLKSHSELESVN